MRERRNWRILASALCSLLFAFDLGWAQSFFAMRGFGEEIMVSDAASSGLGGLLCAASRNPAYPIATTKTNFTFSAIALANYGQRGDVHRIIGDARPAFLKIRAPLPLRLRLGLGLTERFNQDFDVYSDSYPQYRRRVMGKGGVYDVNLSLARSFARLASVAVQYSRLFGGSDELWRFDAYEGNYVTTDTIHHSYSGDALTLGLFGTLGPISLSGFYEPTLDFNINSWVHTHGAVVQQDTERGVDFPPRCGAGIVFAPTKTLKFHLEGAQQKSSQITIDGRTRSMFRNSLQGIIGTQYMLDEIHPLRLGIRYHEWYLSATGNAPIKEIALTAGSSLPISNLGSFDFSLEYARRTGGALAENVLRANLSLYFEEPWKARRRRWGY